MTDSGLTYNSRSNHRFGLNEYSCITGIKKSLHYFFQKQESRRCLQRIKNAYRFVSAVRQPFLSRGKARSGFPKHLSCMPEHTLPSPQKARSAFPKSLYGMTGMSRMSHIWAYNADCQIYTRNAHKSRICVHEPLPSAVGRSRGVEDWQEWIIMHIIDACRCKHACW